MALRRGTAAALRLRPFVTQHQRRLASSSSGGSGGAMSVLEKAAAAAGEDLTPPHQRGGLSSSSRGRRKGKETSEERVPHMSDADRIASAKPDPKPWSERIAPAGAHADRFYESMIVGDHIALRTLNTAAFKAPLPVSESTPRLNPNQWVKLDPIERLTCVVDSQRAVDDFFNDDATLPRTAEDIEDDVDDRLPKFPSPSLRTVAPVPLGGATIVEEKLKAEPLRIGVSPVLATWLGYAMSIWLRVLHDVMDITARKKNPHANVTPNRAYAHRAHVLPTKYVEQFVDFVVQGDMVLGDRGAQFENTEGRHIEVVVIRRSDFVARAEANDPFHGVAEPAAFAHLVTDRNTHLMPCDHDARLAIMAAFAAVATQLFVHGNCVELHTDCPNVAAVVRHVFRHLIQQYNCLELRTYGAAAALDIVAQHQGTGSAGDTGGAESLLHREGTVASLRPIPEELGESYVSPALLANTFVVLGTDDGPSLWTVPFMVDRVARYIAEQKPRVILYDPAWSQANSFMQRVKTLMRDAAHFENALVWQPVERLALEWGDAVMTPCVTVFASTEQRLSKRFKGFLHNRMDRHGVEERRAESADIAKRDVVGVLGSARAARTRKGKTIAREAARLLQTDEFRRPMRVVGINVSAHDVLFTHPQLEFSSGRVGNALRFSSVQRTVVWRPFASSSWFSGLGGGLQPQSEEAKESRSALRQERASKVLQRSVLRPIVHYISARVLGV